MARQPLPPDPIRSIPTTFQVGTHTLKVWRLHEGRWTVAVDEGPLARSYETQVEAWEAGVQEADRRDRSH
jgi:hypothetical protein